MNPLMTLLAAAALQLQAVEPVPADGVRAASFANVPEQHSDEPPGLPRRPIFGAQLEGQPADAEVQGIIIRMVIDGFSAQRAGLRAGDLVVAVDEIPTPTVAVFLGTLRERRAGEELGIDFVREGERQRVTVILTEMPRESYPDIEVIYDHIEVNGARLRTILTHPQGASGPLPTVVLVGGVGCYSVDTPLGEPQAYRRILVELTRLNCTTLRVEKSGIGDSEGPPCAEQSFQSEVAGYVQAARAVRRYPFVDGSEVYLFGHSMGGLHAPLIDAAVADDAPIAGIMAMGTVGTSWFAYEMENGRRQLPLYGVPPEEVEDRLAAESRCVAALVAEKRSPEDIVAEWPECEEYMGFPAHYTYRREIVDLSLPENWRRAQAPVLLIYGASDFLTSAAEHHYIGGVVNHVRPGQATVLILEGLDHYFQSVPSYAESIRAARGEREAEYDPRVHEELHRWMSRMRGR